MGAETRAEKALLTQGKKNQETEQPSPKVASQDQDSKLASGLEQLAFRLHDFANRLMGYLR